MKSRHRRYLTFSGWVSLIANVLAITGFLIDHWLLSAWQPDTGLWVVFSFVTTTYTLVIWSTWAWRRSMRADVARQSDDNIRGGLFLLNAMAALPALTIWFYMVLTTLNDPVLTTTLRWILSLAIAWAGTPFVAMGLNWTGAAVGSTLSDKTR